MACGANGAWPSPSDVNRALFAPNEKRRVETRRLWRTLSRESNRRSGVRAPRTGGRVDASRTTGALLSGAIAIGLQVVWTRLLGEILGSSLLVLGLSTAALLSDDFDQVDELTQFTRRSRRMRIMQGVDLEVAAGEVVGLLGPNGAGKTTTFRMTMGMIQPSGGTIHFAGEEITHWPMFRRARAGMGYLASDAVLEAYWFLPGVLQAESELKAEPVHVTVVGPHDDADAAKLYSAALAYPAVHKRAEWWDKRLGPLANPARVTRQVVGPACSIPSASRG